MQDSKNELDTNSTNSRNIKGGETIIERNMRKANAFKKSFDEMNKIGEISVHEYACFESY